MTPELPIWQGTERPRRCSYLPEQRAALEVRSYLSLTPEELEWYLERGWRRFGTELFRPRCPVCRCCRPVRVDVAGFQPSKSQRRSWRRNASVRVEVGAPQVTAQHVSLYNAWHRDMTERRGWPLQTTDPATYWEAFLSGDFSSSREMRYFDGSRLIGVGLVDLLPNSLSSAYFFHDPAWRAAGPGTFSAICEIGWARDSCLRHLYLGYWIADCPSMAYKIRFQPSEILKEFPDDETPPQWLPYQPGGETAA